MELKAHQQKKIRNDLFDVGLMLTSYNSLENTKFHMYSLISSRMEK